MGCLVLSVFLGYFFMGAFLFLCLEALTMTHLLAEKIKSPFENSNWYLVLCGLLVPLIYTIITSAIIQTDYPDYNRDK